MESRKWKVESGKWEVESGKWKVGSSIRGFGPADFFCGEILMQETEAGFGEGGAVFHPITIDYVGESSYNPKNKPTVGL